MLTWLTQGCLVCFFLPQGIVCYFTVLLCQRNNFREYHNSATPSVKCAFGHARTAKTQFRLRGWSGPSLSAAKIIGYYKICQWRANARGKPCACADDVKLHVMSMLEGIFSLHAARLLISCIEKPNIKQDSAIFHFMSNNVLAGFILSELSIIKLLSPLFNINKSKSDPCYFTSE